jgi:hypothetical protein
MGFLSFVSFIKADLIKYAKFTSVNDKKGMYLNRKAHAQKITVLCQVKGLSHVTEGVGTSRRKAEQEAARNSLRLLIGQ